MYKHLLCMNACKSFGVEISEQIKLLKKVGFEGFFTDWEKGQPIEEWSRLSKELGMIYQSMHAPFGGCRDIWFDEGEKGENAVNEIIECIHDCKRAGVQLIISHCYIGFDGIETPTQLGLERYKKIIDEAENCGINVAFENTEGESYLKAVLDTFRERKNVGFCLDTGHEMCYNFSKDLLALYGDRLIATHINDNLGIRDFGGKIFWHDDLHLLPFDGIKDWKETAERFKKCNYKGILTFELNKHSKPERHENDKYEQMTIEEYFTQSYIAACKFAALL